MTFASFMRVATILRPYSTAASDKSGTPRFSPNGPISPDVRLAGAICWFAGRLFYDIMTTYGIGHSDTVNSCWYVVDAVNEHPDFAIKYPDNHAVQHSIAAGLQKVSGANFQCCAGAIDGILIWTHRPSKKIVTMLGATPEILLKLRSFSLSTRLADRWIRHPKDTTFVLKGRSVLWVKQIRIEGLTKYKYGYETQVPFLRVVHKRNEFEN